jgi:hypothetical protein
VRISPATAKYKLPPSAANSPAEFETGSFPYANTLRTTAEQTSLVTPSTKSVQAHSVSAPLASNQTGSLMAQCGSSPSLPSHNSTQLNSSIMANNPSDDTTTYQNGQGNNDVIGRSPSDGNSMNTNFAGQLVPDQVPSSQKYIISEESWKHHAQARAILSNLIGPNGEQLSSSDPYNTTVFVGGLSPLISEETLRTFFVPFGEIHYVCCLITREYISHLNHDRTHR